MKCIRILNEFEVPVLKGERFGSKGIPITITCFIIIIIPYIHIFLFSRIIIKQSHPITFQFEIIDKSGYRNGIFYN